MPNLLTSIRALPSRLKAFAVWISDGPAKRGIVAAITWLLCRHYGSDFIDQGTVDAIFGLVVAPAVAAWSHETFAKKEQADA